MLSNAGQKIMSIISPVRGIRLTERERHTVGSEAERGRQATVLKVIKNVN